MSPITLIDPHRAAALLPIALLLSSACFDVASLMMRRPQYRETALRIQLLSVVACVAAIALGLLGSPFGGSAGAITASVVRRLPSWITNLMVCAGLAYWRVRRRDVFSGRGQLAFALVSLAGVLAISASGYLGAYIVR